MEINKKRLALLTVIIILLNFIIPNFLFTSVVKAATGTIEEKPFVIKNLGESGGVLTVQIGVNSNEILTGFDFGFKVKSTVGTPCQASGAAGATFAKVMKKATDFDEIELTQQKGTYTAATQQFRITCTYTAGGVEQEGYQELYNLYIKLNSGVDASTLAVEDVIELVPVTGSLPTGLKVSYVPASGTGSVSKDIADLDGDGFAVATKAVTGIAVKTAPTTSTYNHGDAVSLAGGVITVTYDDGSTEDVSMTDPKVKVNSGTPADVNNPKVNIEYGGQTCDVNLTVNDPVDSLAVTNPMNKTNYDEAEAFNFTGLQLTATKRSGATVNLTQSSTGVTTSETVASISSPNFTQTSPAGDVVTKGIQKITFTYEGKTANTTVVVNDAITGINLISQPTKQIYKRGESLNLAGAKVGVALLSGSTTIINLPDGLVTVGSYNPNTTGSKQNLSVRIGTFTSPTTIDVEAYNYISGHTLTAPSKVDYEYGDTLSLTGGRLQFTWASGSGSPSQVNLTSPTVTVSGYSPTTVGIQPLTVTYIATYTLSDGTTINDTITDSYVVQLTNPATSISITNPSKTAYKHGDSLALSDGVITVTYKDTSTRNVPMTASMVKEYGGGAVNLSPAVSAYTSNPLSKILQIEYTEDSITQTSLYPITLENNINLIGMSSNPDKTTYNLGDTAYDLTNGEILVSYAAGNTDTVSLSSSDISLTPLSSLTGTTGTKTVTVTYKGKTTSFNITVQNGVKGITITAPTDVTFEHGDTITFGGGDIDVEYADGTHAHPAITAAMITEAGGGALNMSPSASDYNSTTHDLTKNLTITYTESGITQTANYSITLSNPVSSIAFGTAPATSYNLNDSISYPIGDLIVTRKAGDIDPSPVNITNTMVSGLSTASAGMNKTATVAYGGKSITYNYDVIDNVTGIAITAPTTTNYNHGDPINFAGGSIVVTYASGTTNNVTMTAAMLTEAGGGAVNMSPSYTLYDSNYELSKTLTITYTEGGVTQTASYPITLKNKVTGIAMGTNPSDRNYQINDTTYKISDGDIIVTRAAGNNHTVALSNTSVSLTPLNTLTSTAGTKTVTVTYEGETTSFTITVVNAVDTITVTAPTDVNFEHGDTLTFGGGDIYITYLDGTNRHETITSAMVTETGTIIGPNMSPAATDYNATTHTLTKNLTITYTEDGKTGTANYSITLSNPVTSLAFGTTPRTSYNLNDTPSYPDGTVVATRKAGDTDAAVGITAAMVSGLDTTTAGTGKTATVAYEGQSITYNYDVIDNVTGIVITKPTQTTYNHGDSLNLAGSDIEVTYAGGSTNHVTMTTAMITDADGSATVNMSPAYTDYTNNQLSKTLTIEYTENGVTQVAYYPITIVNNVTSIAMGTNPTNTTYELGESTYDLTGGDIIVTRAIGPTETVALTDSGISLTPLSTLTTATGTGIPVTVTYEGQTTSFDIDVIDGLISINISGTPKTVYELNEAIDSTLSIDVVRGSGTTTIPVTSSMITGFSTATAGTGFTAVIAYEGLTTNYVYDVTDDAVSIAMGTTPKTNYLVGESLDVTGGTIIVTKKSGATETVNIAPTMVSGFDSTSVVTGQTLTVAYSGLTTTYQINVTNPVSSITLNPGPTKTTYDYGEGLDLTGAYIDVVFENGSTDRLAVASSMVSGYDPSTLGAQAVTVTYGKNNSGVDVTTTFTVNVQDYVTGITVTGEKTTYSYGDALDLTQGQVNVIMASGTPAAAVALNNSSVTVTGYSATTLGTQTLTVTYGTQTTTFNVEVEDYITNTSIIVPTQTTYNYGDSLDLSTGSIVQTMASGASNTLPLADSMVTEADGTLVDMTPSSFGTSNTVAKTLKITSDGVTENYPITIVNDVKSITIKQNPKDDYQYGDSIDTSVGSIEVTRGNGQKEEIMLSDPRITFAGFDTSTPGNNIPVTVKFTENGVTKQTTYTIDVNDDISSIQLVGTPKSTYKYGESLDLSGLTLTVVRPSGTTPNVPVTASMASGYDPTTLGSQTITITYGDKTANFTVEVEDYLIGIELVKPTKVTYKKGETLDLTGASITEVMASGAKVTGIPVTPAMVSSLNTTTEGAKTLTVTYTKDGKTYTKQFVVVVQDELSGITVKDFPVDEYLYGEALDLTGATIEVELESGEKTIVPITSSMVSGYTSKPSKDKFDDTDEYIQVLTISYTKDGKTQTTTYPVSMKDYLDGIVVENMQDEYRYGEALNVDGATVAKVMASGRTKDEVQLTTDMVSGYNPNKEGNQTLTITYAGKTTNEVVTVVDNVVAISIKKVPNKTTYNYGEGLDLTGAKLNVVKYSGTSVIDITGDMISGYDPNKEGTQTVTVTYAGFEAEFSVKVLEKPETPVSDDTPDDSDTPVTPIPSTRVVTRVVTVVQEPENTEEEPKVEEEQPKTQEPVVQTTTKTPTVKTEVEKPTKTLGVKDENQNNGLDIVKIIAGIIAILGLLVLLFLLFFKHNVKIYVEEDGEFVLGGLDKLSKNNPKLDIDKYLDEETYPNRVKVHLNDSISEKLDGIEIEITHRGKTVKHKVHYNDEPYEFILDAVSKVEETNK